MYRVKVKIGVALLGGVVAFSAVIASTASAAGSWFVNGTKLAPGVTAAVATTAKVDESTTFNSPSLGVRVTCASGIVKEETPYIQGEVDYGAGSVTVLGCSELEPTTCTVESSLTAKAVVGSVETGTAPLDRIRFSPKEGKTFANIEFHGERCPLDGVQPLNGQYVLDVKEGQTEGPTVPLEGLGTSENNSLELAKDKVYVDGGKALLKLVSGADWSFH